MTNYEFLKLKNEALATKINEHKESINIEDIGRTVSEKLDTIRSMQLKLEIAAQTELATLYSKCIAKYGYTYKGCKKADAICSAVHPILWDINKEEIWQKIDENYNNELFRRNYE